MIKERQGFICINHFFVLIIPYIRLSLFHELLTQKIKKIKIQRIISQFLQIFLHITLLQIYLHITGFNIILLGIK